MQLQKYYPINSPRYSSLRKGLIETKSEKNWHIQYNVYQKSIKMNKLFVEREWRYLFSFCGRFSHQK